MCSSDLFPSHDMGGRRSNRRRTSARSGTTIYDTNNGKNTSPRNGSTTNALSLSYREEWMTKLTDPRTDIVHLEYPNTYRTDKTPEDKPKE